MGRSTTFPVVSCRALSRSLPMLRTLLRAVAAIVAALIFLVVLVAGGGAVWGYRHYMRDLPDVAPLHHYTPSRMTRVFAAGGEEIGSFYLERRIPISIDRIPKRLRQAFIDTEDARFYSHHGVDPQAIIRAFVANVTEGHVAQGGSTITQQLAKVLLLTPERTLDRKIKEALLALRIERQFSKAEILEMYLNQIYFGSGAYGIASAAQTYFGKEPSELDLAEMATLAGLPKAPSGFNPRLHPKRAWQRRAVVLARMYGEHDIALTERRLAEAEPFHLVTPEKRNGEVDYFLELVRQRLTEWYGHKAVYRQGLDVYTTLDLSLQKAAFHAVRDGLIAYDRRHHYRGPVAHHASEEIDLFERDHALDRPGGWGHLPAVVTAVDAKGATIWVVGSEHRLPFATLRWAGKRILDPDHPDEMQWQRARRPADVLSVGDEVLVRRRTAKDGEVRYELSQLPEAEAALVSLRPSDGAILALVGGKDFATSEFNRAVQARRQPGSAFKPFIYGAAIGAGRSPATVYLDSPIIYNDVKLARKWRPANYEQRFYGPTPLREGLVHSRNVITIRLLQDIGIRRAIRFARACGITSPLESNLSLALGASVLSPLELTSAYSTFATGGLHVAPTAIARVVSADGATLFAALPEPKRVISAPVAYVVTDMLRDVVRRGTGRRVGRVFPGRPVAGKTGTTNDYNDAWFLGYTPQIATGVWIGFDELKSLGRRETGARAAAPIWSQYMQAALAELPRLPFTVPPEVRWRRVDKRTGMLPRLGEEEGVHLECFAPGSEPTEVAPVEEAAAPAKDTAGGERRVPVL